MRISDWSSDVCSSDLVSRRALASERIEFVLLKGTAYAAAGLSCAPGRQIGDLDILVLGIDIGRAENELLEAGWEWVKPDPYDDAYYRDHMHELPPLIHKTRDRMIDVHHTRSEEHTSELQSLMRNSYAAFFFKKKT